MKQLELIVLYGPPASGKSTFARQWQQEDPSNRVIVCREDICNMLGVHPGNMSAWINQIERETVNCCLLADKNVIVDSTRKLDWDFLISDAVYLEDEVKIVYKEFGNDLSVEELIARDKARGSKTGEDVIKNWKGEPG